MRSEERSVLQRDLSVAAIMLVTGLFSGGLEALRAVPVVAVTIAVLFVAAVYLGEHDRVPGLFPEVASMSAFILAIIVGTLFVVLLPNPIDVVASSGLTGGGIGYACYRLLFGVVCPVPDYRLKNEQDDESPGLRDGR